MLNGLHPESASVNRTDRRRAPVSLHDLQNTVPPQWPNGPRADIVDLFSGCGSLTLGAASAVVRNGWTPHIALAVDIDQAANRVFNANFPAATVVEDRVESLFDGDLGQSVTTAEEAVRRRIGGTHILIGGPPCQGHSDLNNYTRRNDLRNSLYLRMARAAEVLAPDVTLIENVPTVVHAEEGLIHLTEAVLKTAGYSVDSATVDLSTLGVPQKRKRHILIAIKSATGVQASAVLNEVLGKAESLKSVAWAIADLSDKERTEAFDTPTVVSATNAERIRWLFDNDAHDLPNELRPPSHQGNHSYVSMYGRLRWDAPAQTITTGFGSMGQGRYVHPLQPRMITAHEAARIQGIPDFFRFDAARNRTTMRRLIGNAVPPILSETVIGAALDQIASALCKD